ncbi:hypothetical protein EB001_12415 [bacterium]|jgi:hypothetical protein|nr:hypothetical protein [bacterium]
MFLTLFQKMFRHKDVPNNQTFYNYIKSKTDWEQAVNSLKRDNDKDLDLRVNLKFDADKISQEVYELYREVKAVSWQSQNTFHLYGLSLSYNINHSKDLWKMGCFGHPRYRVYNSKDYYDAVMNDKDNHVKDDYLDSLSFNTLLPEVKTKPHLYKLLNSFNFPVIRVTARTVNGLIITPTKFLKSGWHKDDCPFETLRLNVMLDTEGNHGIEYQNKKVIYTSRGDNLVVNTDKLHRTFVSENSNFQRTSLIINLATWLKYDETNNSYSLNHHYGKTHPYDLAKQNLLSFN